MPANDILSGTVTIRGMAQTQAMLTGQERRVDPRHGLRESMTLAVGMLHRYAAAIVHVLTGRLKNSIFWRIESSGNSIVGQVGTNVVYAPYEHGRGGAHAFFARTVREEGPSVNNLFAVQVRGPE